MKKEIEKKEPVKKKALKNQKKSKEKWFYKFIPKTKSEKILCSLFLLLLIIVIILSPVAIKTVNEAKNNDITNTVSITDQSSNYVMNIDISNMKTSSTKEYKFKVTNYNKKILSEDLTYTISLDTSDNPVSIKLYKNDQLIDLDNPVMELKKDTKQEDIYKVVIEATKKTTEDTSIILTILS